MRCCCYVNRPVLAHLRLDGTHASRQRLREGGRSRLAQSRQKSHATFTGDGAVGAGNKRPAFGLSRGADEVPLGVGGASGRVWRV